jgi:hypothetical protein
VRDPAAAQIRTGETDRPKVVNIIAKRSPER